MDESGWEIDPGDQVGLKDGRIAEGTASGKLGHFYWLKLDGITTAVHEKEIQYIGRKVTASQAEGRGQERYGCTHEYVDVGFTRHKFVCKHCDRERE